MEISKAELSIQDTTVLNSIKEPNELSLSISIFTNLFVSPEYVLCCEGILEVEVWGGAGGAGPAETR